MAVRYFRLISWDKWYPRKEYKSMPWVKLGSRFFEDEKMDDLKFIEKSGVIWILTQAAQQNMGGGLVRIDESVMRSCCGLRWVRDAVLMLTKYVGLGIIIEETPISKHVSSKQELRIRERIRIPFNPLNEKTESRDTSKLVQMATGDKGMDDEDLAF